MENIKELQKQIAELQSENKKLAANLNNIESAFKHAGETEISYLKGQLSRRLSSEYNKFLYVKDREPDIIFYEMFVDMLDGIFKVLKKNGISLDYSEAYRQ